MAGGITDAANNIANDMNMASIMKLQVAREQANQKHSDYMKLRSEVVSHLGDTIKELKIAHPELNDMQLAAHPAVTAMKNMLAGFDKNLKLPETADSIVAGFVAQPSEAVTEAKLAQAKELPDERALRGAETQRTQAQTALLQKQAASDTYTSTPGDTDLTGQPSQEQADAWLKTLPADQQEDVKAALNGQPLSAFSTRTYKGSQKSQRQIVVEHLQHYGELSGTPWNAAVAQQNQLSSTAGLKADTASLTNLQKQRDAVAAFEDTAVANGDKLVQMSKTISNTGVPALNKYTRWYEGNVKGDPAISNFNLQLISVRNEIAKILTNPNLTGQLTDASKNEINEAMQPGATAAQIIGAFQTAKADFANRADALDKRIGIVQGRLKQYRSGSNKNQNSGATDDPLGLLK